VASKFSRFFKELKRRKVYRVAAVYGAVAASIIGFAEPALGSEAWESIRIVVVALILIGLPLALILAWAYEVRLEEPEEREEDVPAGTSEGTSEGASHAKPTIAVLPFDDFSPNPDDAYFAGGMHEEILTQLQKLGGLAVRARTSVLRYRDHPKPVPEIAQELGVQYILEGSARKAGDQVRLTAQLMDAVKDEHIWADNYDRPLSMENLISVQAEIAHQVALELKAVISLEEGDLSADKPTESLEAYEEYLRGMHFARRYTKGGFRKGIEHFERAISLDETYAAARVGLGYCYKEMSELSYIDPVEGYPKARIALTRALELDASLGEAHAILASMKFSSEWDMSGPDPMFRLAVEVSPDNALVFILYGTYLMHLGRGEESIEMLRRGVELDPLNPMANTWLACGYFYSHRHEESIQAHKRLLELEPNWHWAHIYLSHNYSVMGKHTQALAHATEVEVVGRAMGDNYLVTHVGGSFAWAGEEEKAQGLLHDAIGLHGKGSMDAVSVAVIFAQLGDKENAFKWLDRAIDEHAGLAIYLKIYGGTFLRDLKSDPRFDEILRRVGFPA